MGPKQISVCIAAVLTLLASAAADDAFYRVRLTDLTLTEGALPPPATDFAWHGAIAWYMTPGPYRSRADISGAP